MVPPDPRRVVGASVYAKALQVAPHDGRRILGVDADKMWLKGTVMEVLISRPEGARRATTLIKASYNVGNSEKVKILNLQLIKKDDPTAAATAPATATGTVTAPTAAPTTGNTGNGSDGAAVTATEDSSSEGVQESTQPTEPSSVRNPVTTTNDGRQWYDGATDIAVNGPFTERGWRLTDQYTGKDYTPGIDETAQEIRPLDCFMALFPKKQLSEMVERTNAELTRLGHVKMTRGELLKFFGVMILMPRFEFGDRSSLWATSSSCKYIPTANFGLFMPRERFHFIFTNMVWSVQPTDRPEHMSHENWRWMLVEDFVANFNDHRQRYFTPSFEICVDESMVRWYGLGGSWINMGLPMYVAIDRKPENGLEIQDACCAMSNIMLRLKLVKSADAIQE